ncbi:polysaccharide biosynthesis/export family protein [Pseudomonas sp. AA-38]|uniref:polysaccharide biosynthesis/export family protein n=1 Tax=Pseudomonas sp. AA-38 TaxID=3028807 RepID=UPI0023F681F3|nr:polysaccharide biosynthesis/export family protein [Pseudomonas sp. AA-38]
MFAHTKKSFVQSSVVVALLALLLVGCSTPARVHLPDDEALKQRHQEIYKLADLPPPQVRIQSGDTLRIVRDAQEPSEKDDMTLFVVRPDGYFSMPYVGLIKADGRTPEDVAKEVTSKLSKIYRRPNATVNIAIAPSNKVFIGGAVPNAAFFDLVGHATLEQVLLASGGVLPSADSDNIALLRAGDDGKYKMYFFSLASLLQDKDRPMIAMQRGDLIYVPQSGIGSTVEAVDMYFTRLFPINKGIGVGFNYDLNGTRVKNSGNTTNIENTSIGPVDSISIP